MTVSQSDSDSSPTFPRMLTPGVVDEDVDAAEVALRHVREAAHAIRCRDLGLDALDPGPACGRDLRPLPCARRRSSGW